MHQTTIELKVNTLNIKHNKIKKSPPILQEIARLKNIGTKLFKIFVKNDVIALVGNKNAKNIQKYLAIFKFLHTYFLIIFKFNKADIVKQLPIAQIKAFMPIYFGKNHMHKSIKIAPTI